MGGGGSYWSCLSKSSKNALKILYIRSCFIKSLVHRWHWMCEQGALLKAKGDLIKGLGQALKGGNKGKEAYYLYWPFGIGSTRCLWEVVKPINNLNIDPRATRLRKWTSKHNLTNEQSCGDIARCKGDKLCLGLIKGKRSKVKKICFLPTIEALYLNCMIPH